MTVRGSSLISIVVPRTSGRPPNRSCQVPYRHDGHLGPSPLIVRREAPTDGQGHLKHLEEVAVHDLSHDREMAPVDGQASEEGLVPNHPLEEVRVFTQVVGDRPRGHRLSTRVVDIARVDLDQTLRLPIARVLEKESVHDAEHEGVGRDRNRHGPHGNRDEVGSSPYLPGSEAEVHQKGEEHVPPPWDRTHPGILRGHLLGWSEGLDGLGDRILRARTLRPTLLCRIEEMLGELVQIRSTQIRCRFPLPAPRGQSLRGYLVHPDLSLEVWLYIALLCIIALA